MSSTMDRASRWPGALSRREFLKAGATGKRIRRLPICAEDLKQG